MYRTIVSKTAVEKIDGIPLVPNFWKHGSGLYVFTSSLGDDDFEVTARIRIPRQEQEPVSWGCPVDMHSLLPQYNDFCQPIRRVLRLAAEGETQEFALFSGPRLDRVTSHGNIAFIGDASHALLGNFGSGAGFALEDVYTLAKAVGWGYVKGLPLVDALDFYNSVRSPHYRRLYELMDNFSAIKATLRTESLSVDEEIAERVRRISLASESWMYHYEIEKVVEKALCAVTTGVTDSRRLSGSQEPRTIATRHQET